MSNKVSIGVFITLFYYAIVLKLNFSDRIFLRFIYYFLLFLVVRIGTSLYGVTASQYSHREHKSLFTA